MATRSIARSCLQAPSSAAISFLQLAPPRRHIHIPSTPLFEFLTPRLQTTRTTTAITPRRNAETTISAAQTGGRRAFTNTARRQDTRAILNAQKDDDGNEMNLEITPRAATRLQEIMKKDSNPNLALRISVESGGCHGFQYLLSTTTLPSLSAEGSPSPNDTNIMPTDSSASASSHGNVAALGEEDVVFAEDGSGAKVVIDASSLELLSGSLVDFTNELIGSSFKVINKKATSSCGCGTSFDIKF